MLSLIVFLLCAALVSATPCPPLPITEPTAWLGYVDALPLKNDNCSEHAGFFTTLNDGFLGTKVDSYQASDSDTGLLDYVAVVFPYPVLATQIRLYIGTFRDGGWWGPSAGPGTGGALTLADLTVPTVQVSQQVGFVGLNWTSVNDPVTPSSDYLTVLNGHVVSAGGGATLSDEITFNFAQPVSGRAFRLIGPGGGRPSGRGQTAGFLCVYEIEVIHTTMPTMVPTQQPTLAPTDAPTDAPSPAPIASTTTRFDEPWETKIFDKTLFTVENLDRSTFSTSEVMETTTQSTPMVESTLFIGSSEEGDGGSSLLLDVTIAVVVITLFCLLMLAVFYFYQRRSARKSSRPHKGGASGVRSPRAPHSPRPRSSAPSARTSHYKSGRRSARRSLNYGFIPALGSEKSGTSSDMVVMSTYMSVGELERGADATPPHIVGVYRPVNVDEDGNGYGEIPGSTPTVSTNEAEYAVGDLAATTNNTICATEYGTVELTNVTEYGVGEVGGAPDTEYVVGDLSEIRRN